MVNKAEKPLKYVRASNAVCQTPLCTLPSRPRDGKALCHLCQDDPERVARLTPATETNTAIRAQQVVSKSNVMGHDCGKVTVSVPREPWDHTDPTVPQGPKERGLPPIPRI